MKRTANHSHAIENTPLKIFVTLLTVLALTPAALAGIADSTVPDLSPGGPKTSVLYSVPGVQNAGNLGTYFGCTSTATTAQQVAVELFDASGGAPVNSAVGTQFTLNAGATVLFGTVDAGGIGFEHLLGTLPAFVGSARVLSTSKSLICTAFVADIGNNPPTSMVYLTMVAKTKQKGE